MAEDERLICLSHEVEEGGKGVRFSITEGAREIPAFVIRFKGAVYAYRNQCSHVPAQLDWQPGEFFDVSKLYLICSIHGALYSPETGQCLGGRCHGVGLKTIPVDERAGKIYLAT